MHPTKTQLELYVNNCIDDNGLRITIERHVAACTFCQEYCDSYRKIVAETSQDEIPENVLPLVDRIFNCPASGTVIDLVPLMDSPQSGEIYLAADGGDERPVGNSRIATLYSENPEIVLRIVRDSGSECDYLQVIAADKRLSAHVLVTAPEFDLEFITDDNGYTQATAFPEAEIESMKWQIRLPEAVFFLEPVPYDKNAPLYSDEKILTTDKGDEIKVTFDRLADGVNIAFSVLAINGDRSFSSARAAITLPSGTIIKTMAPNQKVVLQDLGPAEPFDIRIY